MNATQARWLERGIITLCVAALLMIFQPFSLQLFSLGCILVIVGGLIFNIVPFCRAGVSYRQLFKVLLIVFIILVIAALLGISTAFLYVDYLASLR